ncbi:MAG TPA: MerR family transcriptional regulator [Bacillales bacterium]|nr:MerR family transcriptional regulator [Bacillales bacterium]
MKIKEAAEKLNLSPQAIRFYEEKGLIAPEKQKDNQYRVFSDADVERLKTIGSFREIGMPIEAIQKALKEMDEGKSSELLAYLDRQRSEMADQWVALKDMMDTTDQMIHRLRKEETPVSTGIHQLADKLKRLKKLRQDWEDRWNFDNQAARYDRQVYESVGNFNIHANYDEALDLTFEWIDPVSGERGLEIGIGTGNLAGRFVEAGARMFGVDQSTEMLNQCRKKFPEVETKLGHFLALPYQDHQFDFVVTSYALHHLEEDQKELALQEMGRVLIPSGRICITDLMFQNQEDRVEYLRLLEERGRLDIAAAIEDEYFADRSRLLRWFEKHGYETKTKKVNHFLHMLQAKKM